MDDQTASYPILPPELVGEIITHLFPVGDCASLLTLSACRRVSVKLQDDNRTAR